MHARSGGALEVMGLLQGKVTLSNISIEDLFKDFQIYIASP